MATIKIKSTHKETQGEFIIIDEQDFDSKIHVVYNDQPKQEAPQPKQRKVRNHGLG